MGLRSLRKEKGLTQEELAEMVHVDQTAISQWERGVTQPRLKNCLQLAKALSCARLKIFVLCQSKALKYLYAKGVQSMDPQKGGNLTVKELLDILKELSDEELRLYLLCDRDSRNKNRPEHVKYVDHEVSEKHFFNKRKYDFWIEVVEEIVTAAIDAQSVFKYGASETEIRRGRIII